MADITIGGSVFNGVNKIRVKTSGGAAVEYGEGGGSGETVYVVGTPVECILSNWNVADTGTTTTFDVVGYMVGSNGLQIGLPSNSSVFNTQAVVEAALTIPTYTETESGVTITISAVNAPTETLTIAIFGLEPLS